MEKLRAIDKEKYFEISEKGGYPKRCPILHRCERRACTLFLSHVRDSFVLNKDAGSFEQYKKRLLDTRDIENELIPITGEAPVYTGGNSSFGFFNICPEVSLFDSDNIQFHTQGLAVTSGSYDKYFENQFKSVIHQCCHFSECAEYNRFISSTEMNNNFNKVISINKISHSFLSHASDILADTNKGLTGTEIVKFFVAKSVDYNVDIPHSKSPLTDVANKRTAFLENLLPFTPEQQFQIIIELSENEKFKTVESVIALKQKLVSQYSNLVVRQTTVDKELVLQTKHFLEKFPAAYKPYRSGIEKFEANLYERNCLDDLRLSLELLLKGILNNSKSLENQTADLGKHQQNKGLSTEVSNMFNKRLDYYSKYQNNYVKHNDKVNGDEVEFIINLTNTFMRLLSK